ncbi:hypothetical protein D0962_33300 [Leptolyngbyaceae cyanobacterium CCMR0082]|uniref:Uncharacterized protein n=3 Tax=Adonisia TaxID=2950183 RepID=A0A6M0SJ53_9CYAN|nr:hypothetical protein [Adonisia turfae CCMR0081]NEZ67582.1 hypothetical protein [Adonisia turfae CCMR0082]
MLTMLKKLCLAGELLGLVLLFNLLLVPAIQAAPLCRTVDNHQVCVLKITRSAKYYWEYRAVVQVDDTRRPMGRYNCHTHEYIRRDGQPVADDIATQVICAFFKS